MHLLRYRRDRFFVVCVLLTGLLSAANIAYGQDAETIYPIIENGRFGFINAAGERVIEPKYDGAQVSSEGLAAVRLGYAWGFIDTQDSVLIKPQYSSVFPFANGAARVQSGQYWSFIDRTGKPITDKYFTAALDFSEGLASVRERPGTVVGLEPKWGYINKAGQTVLPENYVRALPFSDGLAAVEVVRKVFVVRVNTRWGLIDTTGTWVVEPIFNAMRNPTEGLALARRGRQHGFIDSTGLLY